jgi:hypothetical protein
LYSNAITFPKAQFPASNHNINIMLFSGHITDADLEVAVHTDPSTDQAAWQQGAQTIEEYFGPDGTFWSEPITPNGEYIVEHGMIASGEASSGTGTGIRSGNESGMGISSDNNIGADIGMSSSIGGAMDDLNINNSSDCLQEHATAINATPQYYVSHHFPRPQSRLDQQQYPGLNQETVHNPSSPTAQEANGRPDKNPSPTVEIKAPAQYDKMHAELSYPITPQLGTPYIRGRKTSATKGAKEMRREMVEEQVPSDSPAKRVSDDLKRKKRKNGGGQVPIRPRKQPKRAAKSATKK